MQNHKDAAAVFRDRYERGQLAYETIRNHPALRAGDEILALDVNRQRLLLYPHTAKELVRRTLSDPPEFDWPHRVSQKVSYINFIVTNRCNARCSYCFAGETTPSDLSTEMATEMARALPQVLDLDANYYPGIFFFGGEPTLNMPAVKAIMDVANANRWDIIPKISTNGLFDEKLTKYLERESFIVQFSYDGERGNRLRFPKERTAVLLRNIRNCREAGLPMIFRPTITSLNAPHLDELIDELISLGGTNTLSINPGILSRNKGFAKAMDNSLDPEYSTYRKQYYAFIEKAYMHGIKVNNIHVSNLQRSHGKTDIPAFVSTDGRISIGCIYGNSADEEQMTFGLFSDSQYKFDFERLETMRKNFLANKFLHYSQDCFCRATCRGAKKSIKCVKKLYPQEHMHVPDDHGYFFQADAECACNRIMLEALLLLALNKSLEEISQQAVGVDNTDFLELDIAGILTRLHRPDSYNRRGA